MAARAREPDPPAQVEALVASLAPGRPFPRGILVRGEERWFRARAVRAAQEAAAARGLEIARHDALDPDFDLARLLADLSAPPMFGDARLIVASGVQKLLERAQGGDPPLLRGALAFLRDRTLEGALLLDVESLRADHPLARAVAELPGPVVTCRRLWDTPPPWNPDPRRTELVVWIAARARDKGLRVTAEEAQYLAAATGNDLFALEDALEALRARGRRSLRETVGWTAGASPFETAEHLLRGDLPRALPAIEALLRGGFQERDGTRQGRPEVSLSVLLGSLRSKLRPTLAVARALERGEELDAAVARASGSSARSRADLAARARLRPAEEWARMSDELVALERRTRTSVGADESDLFALALAWRRKARPAASGR